MGIRRGSEKGQHRRSLFVDDRRVHGSVAAVNDVLNGLHHRIQGHRQVGLRRFERMQPDGQHRHRPQVRNPFQPDPFDPPPHKPRRPRQDRAPGRRLRHGQRRGRGAGGRGALHQAPCGGARYGVCLPCGTAVSGGLFRKDDIVRRFGSRDQSQIAEGGAQGRAQPAPVQPPQFHRAHAAAGHMQIQIEGPGAGPPAVGQGLRHSGGGLHGLGHGALARLPDRQKPIPDKGNRLAARLQDQRDKTVVMRAQLLMQLLHPIGAGGKQASGMVRKSGDVA